MLQRTLMRSLALWLLFPTLAHASVWLQGGESLIEQGDFLLYPGVQMAVELEDSQRFRLDFTGRRFGSFLEATTMLSWDRNFEIFPWPALKARYGLTILDAYTAYDPPGASAQSVHDLNVGATLGLSYQLWEGDGWRLKAEWNSHVYAAGLAFLFLTTARKSIFTLGAEVAL